MFRDKLRIGIFNQMKTRYPLNEHFQQNPKEKW